MCARLRSARVVEEEREEWRGVKESGLNCVCVAAGGGVAQIE